MKRIAICAFLISLTLMGCQKEETPAPTEETMYFPPVSGSAWETKTTTSLGWKPDSIQKLKDFLAQTNSKSFMILINGRIVMEEYFNGHTASDQWTWNSAGKTLVATTTGIAQQEGWVNINNKVSSYIGTGWTTTPLAKENLITVRNLLTMTSGLSDSSNLVIPANLTYMADAGTRWAYGNVFQKLMDVVEDGTSQTFETYFNSKLKNKIGMDGSWNFGPIFKIYSSNTRSMARFGLMALNKGKWNNEQIINETYFTESTTTSNTLNPSYGYLWWLNGKGKYMVPQSQTVYNTNLVLNAPADMFAAMGAQDNRIYVIPSKKMVIVRMGDFSDPNNPVFALSGYDFNLWTRINAVIN